MAECFSGLSIITISEADKAYREERDAEMRYN
jgi:hypothetical protein